jgi:hypothetical protein
MPMYRVIAGVVSDANGINHGVNDVIMIDAFDGGHYLGIGAVEEYSPQAVAPPDMIHSPMSETSDIPDIEKMNADEAIEAINGISGEGEATILTLLLDSEESGKKRKTVIAAIKERTGFAN